MHPIVRRGAIALAAPALTVSALVATSAPASAAPDPAPATAAGSWLAGQLEGGLILSPYLDEEGNPYPDFGASIDAALSFDAIGAPESVVDQISAGVAGGITDYTSYADDRYAGATAKAAVLAQIAGDDPTSFGGVNLIAQLEGLVSTEGATAGRIEDRTAFDDYANAYGQAFAARALDAAGSDLTDSVTDFLLAQQCEDGFFRQQFSAKDAADQSCDGGAGEPDVDATALAIQSLQSQLDDTDVAAHVADAVAWLKDAQMKSGGFGADSAIPDANTNSTGMAAYALALAGETDAAAGAAAWLRAHQLTNVANCVYYDAADVGALAYDDAARTTAQAGPMDADLRYQSQRSTAQALFGLASAQTGTGDPHALFAAEYVKAGVKHGVGVIDAAPGEALCAMLGEQSVLGYANDEGEATLKVLVPKKTATSSVDVANAGSTFDTAEINALGATKLQIGLKSKRVAGGQKQVVTVRGLAPGELAKIKVTWPSGPRSASSALAAGQANNRGVFRFGVKADKVPGTAKVTATGQFKNRSGTTSFTVTR